MTTLYRAHMGSAAEDATSRASDGAYLTLVERVRRGLYPPGTRLPGERALATELGISRSTLRQALNRLSEAGLLMRSSQRGWFIPRPLIGEPPSVLQSFTEMARERGLTPTAVVLARSTRSATLTEAERLRIAPAEPVLELRRLRGMNQTVVCIEDSVLVGSRTQALTTVDLKDASLYEALDTWCDVVVSRSSYSVQALAATPAEAHLLHVAEGSPLLVGREVAFDARGVPILTSKVSYRGDAYRFEADLYRPINPIAGEASRPLATAARA